MDLATTEDVVIVPIEGEGFASLKEKYPFFDQSAIPGGTYSQAEDVLTASIMNQLLVSPDLDEEQVYKMTKALFENLDTLHASQRESRWTASMKAQQSPSTLEHCAITQNRGW